jgi:FkbM family methyltransferase
MSLKKCERSQLLKKMNIKSIRKIIIDGIVNIGLLKRPSIRYCIDNELLPSLLARTSCNTARKVLNLPASEFQTQLNQDIFALLMNQFRPGFFIEIGANDGYTLSNTVYLEENFGWKGILVEPNDKYLLSLEKRKKSIVINKAISSKTGKAEFIDAGLYGGLKAVLDETHNFYTNNAQCISVDCMALQDILDSASAPEQIDFISIDVEGGEVPVTEQMVSSNRRFRCGCIEYNKRIEDYKQIVALLKSADYEVVWNEQTEQDLFFVDRACPINPLIRQA